MFVLYGDMHYKTWYSMFVLYGDIHSIKLKKKIWPPKKVKNFDFHGKNNLGSRCEVTVKLFCMVMFGSWDLAAFSWKIIFLIRDIKFSYMVI